MMPNIKPIVITPEIMNLVAEIDEFKGRWQAMENLAPERLHSLKRIATIESVGSSTRIEGSKLTDVQVESLLSNLKTKSFTTRDEQEVAGYADVMDMVFTSYGAMTITENHIKQLHGILLQYSTKDEDHRGEYKKLDNHVEAFGPDGNSLGVVFQTTSPFETPTWMQELVRWYNQSVVEQAQHPLVLIAIFIVVFLAIHPFKDGNGRLSRILTTLLLLRAGYGYVPYSSMESIVENNKHHYYLSLRRTQQTIRTQNQNWQPWVEFFLRTMRSQKNNLLTKIEAEKSLKAQLPALSRQIIELARTRSEVTIKDVETSTGANRNTIKAHVRHLVSGQYLAQHGRGRGVRYTLK